MWNGERHVNTGTGNEFDISVIDTKEKLYAPINIEQEWIGIFILKYAKDLKFCAYFLFYWNKHKVKGNK